MHEATTTKKGVLKKWQLYKDDEDKEVYNARQKAVVIATEKTYA